MSVAARVSIRYGMEVSGQPFGSGLTAVTDVEKNKVFACKVHQCPILSVIKGSLPWPL